MSDPRPTSDSVPEGGQKTWTQLAKYAVFLLGVVGTFLFPPPVGATGGDSQTWVRLAQFVVTVMVGLVLILAQRWNRRRHTKRWVLIALAALAASLGAYFAYQTFLDARTCKYDGQAVVIGSEYTPHALEYLKETPNSTCESLLQDYGGQAADIWTKDSINRSRYVLVAAYVGTMPLLTLCIIAVVQAVACSQAKNRS